MKVTKKYLKDLVYQVNSAAIKVHKTFGAGLTERICQRCMNRELTLRGLRSSSNLAVPLIYKGERIDADLRCDMLMENTLVIELKSVEAVLPLHHAQILTYMKLLEGPMGLLINFNVDHIFKQGQKTIVNDLYRVVPD
jgi:GxxExxY protein